jgi:hypothetical protein
VYKWPMPDRGTGVSWQLQVPSWCSAAEGREQVVLVEVQEVVLRVPGPQGEAERRDRGFRT